MASVIRRRSNDRRHSDVYPAQKRRDSSERSRASVHSNYNNSTGGRSTDEHQYYATNGNATYQTMPHMTRSRDSFEQQQQQQLQQLQHHQVATLYQQQQYQYPTTANLAPPMMAHHGGISNTNQFAQPQPYPAMNRPSHPMYNLNNSQNGPAYGTRNRTVSNNTGTTTIATSGRIAANTLLRPMANTSTTTTEVIDLTGSPSSSAVPNPPTRKRRRDPNSSQPHNQHHLAASTSSRPSSQYHDHSSSYPESYASTVSSHPHPVPLPLPPCDDPDGHFVVNINEDLTPRYKILRLLGQGTFGKVVEAFDKHKKMHVAIKIIRSVQKYRDASKIEIKVLQTIKSHDPQNIKRCIHLRDVFDYRNHICMVFEVLSQSVFDFLKENKFLPFSMDQIRDFARQILVAVEFCHSLRLIHTDLKPENLMLEQNAYSARPYKKGTNPNGQPVLRRELNSTYLRLIDFGSAIFEDDYHSSIVSTRHYRAPEIILSMGWSYPCDIWSIGCILVEFFTGEALFQTHDNLEHLAMMEQTLGKFPPEFIAMVPNSYKYFKGGKLDWPNQEVNRSSKAFVRKLNPLEVTIRPTSIPTISSFLSLVRRMLEYDPAQRITAREALNHPFFTENQGLRQM
ncbi:hypothetical protein SmJEL517_g06188 [Synchytrium microbalum]|uniref:Protein kinase domain-containing protein n=1 Tax=Synchytrium microbalum TaxID=1806994 RepID=A0A507BQW2_9FUNG|nr:uncharacterized protein SmJEL517_g06188 [Synchytrium microbalum]TPX30192.1 hypothetical protein SmJEL517_g06188 [Synchytrium microbalum]